MSNETRSARWAWLAVLGLSVFIAVFAAGCGSDDSSDEATSETLTEVGEGEGELNLIAWAGYAEDGSTDPKVDWVTPFEEETGCQVNVKTGNTSDDMVNLMRTGDYDGVSASGDATLRLIEGGDVDPVNTDLVPNYADVFDSLKDQGFNSVDGQAYGIPHGRGANLLMYDTEDVRAHSRRPSRPSGAYGPCGGGGGRSRDRAWSASGHGSHAREHAFSSWAARFSSCGALRSAVNGGPHRPDGAV